MTNEAAPPAGGNTAGNTAPPPAGGNTAPPPASNMPSDWTSTFTDELKGYVQTKGFKDPSMVVESYRNYEKLMGVPKDRLMKLPEKEDAPEWGEVWDKLGKPKEAKDYKFDAPGEGLQKDEAFETWAKDMFHKNNVTSKQGAALVKEWNNRTANAQKEQTETMEINFKQQETSLKKEWGAAYEQNAAIADKAVDLFGDQGPAVLKAIGQAIGFDKGLKMLHSLGTKLSEDTFVGGDRNNSSFGNQLTPEQAKFQISSKKGDPEFTRRYIAGEAGPRQEMQKLHEMAYPEE